MPCCVVLFTPPALCGKEECLSFSAVPLRQCAAHGNPLGVWNVPGNDLPRPQSAVTSVPLLVSGGAFEAGGCCAAFRLSLRRPMQRLAPRRTFSTGSLSARRFKCFSSRHLSSRRASSKHRVHRCTNMRRLRQLRPSANSLTMSSNNCSLLLVLHCRKASRL